MTIGVGFSGPDYIILGCDMEMTGVAKYPGIKDHFKWFARELGVIAAIYSGGEDDIRCVWEEIEDRIDAKEKDGTSLEIKDVREILVESLAVVITDRRSTFQMLVAISKREGQIQFLRVFGKRVSPAESWDIIGRGDTELTRYLAHLMPKAVNQHQALFWTAHIINTANKFIQGVGQGIRLSVVSPGRVHHLYGSLFTDQLAIAESQIAGIWMNLCNIELSREEFSKYCQSFAGVISELKGKIPRVLQ
jgi:hypothetical protein